MMRLLSSHFPNVVVPSTKDVVLFLIVKIVLVSVSILLKTWVNYVKLLGKESVLVFYAAVSAVRYGASGSPMARAGEVNKNGRKLLFLVSYIIYTK